MIVMMRDCMLGVAAKFPASRYSVACLFPLMVCEGQGTASWVPGQAGNMLLVTRGGVLDIARPDPRPGPVIRSERIVLTGCGRVLPYGC